MTAGQNFGCRSVDLIETQVASIEAASFFIVLSPPGAYISRVSELDTKQDGANNSLWHTPSPVEAASQLGRAGWIIAVIHSILCGCDKNVSDKPNHKGDKPDVSTTKGISHLRHRGRE
jgi:hypothetical protein